MANVWLDLVILRHGEAESFFSRDHDRALTDYGRTRVAEQASLLAETGFKPEEIVHSPYVRTTETANVCQSIFQAPEIRSDNCLMHSAQPEQVPLLWGDSKSLLIVSHMPLVGRLIQYLCPQSDIHGLPVAGFVRLKTDLLSLESQLTLDGRC